MAERQNYYRLMLNFRSVQIRYLRHMPRFMGMVKDENRYPN